MKIIIFIINILFVANLFSQQLYPHKYNLDFEKRDLQGKLPEGWFRMGSKRHQISTDTIVKHTGNSSVLISSDINTEEEFACIASAIPITQTGKKIELKAYLKLQDVTSPIGLMLRIDGENEVLKFDNIMQRKIRGTIDWAEYSVVLSLPEKAKTIYVGAILSGSGKLWADDFKLYIDGKDFLNPIKSDTKFFNADIDTLEYRDNSGIIIKNLTSAQIKDLDLLGKCWGFIKYYHPAIGNGEYNWDFELFRIMDDLLKAPTPYHRNKILYKWIKKIGQDSKHQYIPKIESDTSNIKVKEDSKWIEDESLLGKDLSLLLQKIKSLQKSENHYYVNFLTGIGNPVFKHENPYPNMRYPDAGYRLLSLFRYWNIIQYYFPYKYLIKEDWNNILPEFIPKFVSAKNELEYQLSLIELITRVHDTHASLYQSRIALDTLKGIYFSPLKIEFIEENAVVTGFINDSLSQTSNLQKGDVLTKINNKSIKQIIKERSVITPASNEPTRLRNIAWEILRSTDSSINIEFTRNRQSFSTNIKCYLPNTTYTTISSKKPSYKVLNNNIGYIFIGTLACDSIKYIMDKFKETKAIIIDLRGYPTDFPLFNLGEYLMPQPNIFAKVTCVSKNIPGRFIFASDVSVGKKNPEYYKGRVIILINEYTQSSAEYHAMAFKTAPRAILMGSTTAGADGNVSNISLPGGIKTMISGIGIYYPDGSETQQIGILPDIIVKPTIESIIESRDIVLESAIEYINSNK